jgi:hypothetical protein
MSAPRSIHRAIADHTYARRTGGSRPLPQTRGCTNPSHPSRRRICHPPTTSFRMAHVPSPRALERSTHQPRHAPVASRKDIPFHTRHRHHSLIRKSRHHRMPSAPPFMGAHTSNQRPYRRHCSPIDTLGIDQPPEATRFSWPTPLFAGGKTMRCQYHCLSHSVAIPQHPPSQAKLHTLASLPPDVTCPLSLLRPVPLNPPHSQSLIPLRQCDQVLHLHCMQSGALQSKAGAEREAETPGHFACRAGTCPGACRH